MLWVASIFIFAFAEYGAATRSWDVMVLWAFTLEYPSGGQLGRIYTNFKYKW